VTESEERALEIVRGLPGVVRAEPLAREDREALARLFTPTSAENEAMRAALARQRVVCLFKDSSFRPPPEPTVLLVDESGNVLGREVLPGEAPPSSEDRRLVFLGKDFVLFRGSRPRGRYRFSLPPVPFPELEALPDLANVVSASPDTPQDDYLKERFRIPRGRDLASIVVGFDGRKA